MTKSIAKQGLDQDTALATRGGHCGKPGAQASDSLENRWFDVGSWHFSAITRTADSRPVAPIKRTSADR